MKTAQELLEDMREEIRDAKAKFNEVVAAMPDVAETDHQKALQAKHGSPRAFAAAIVECIGEVSITEARDAICAYHDEWRAAK